MGPYSLGFCDPPNIITYLQRKLNYKRPKGKNSTDEKSSKKNNVSKKLKNRSAD